MSSLEDRLDEVFRINEYPELDTPFLAIRFMSRRNRVWIGKSEWYALRKKLAGIVRQQVIDATQPINYNAQIRGAITRHEDLELTAHTIKYFNDKVADRRIRLLKKLGVS